MAFADILRRTAPAARKGLERAYAPLIGLISFMVVVGPGPLRPTNISWLRSPDPAQAYLGWAFFRASPWTWPPAANPHYGLELSGSILMSDSNPLLAMFFKLFDPLLPHPFQYLGMWLLLCFMLQAKFGYSISRLIFERTPQRLLSSIMFVFTAPFLARFVSPALFHFTLSGQWEVLAAIYIYMLPVNRWRTVWWTLLIVAGVLTNTYLLAMTAAIWLSDVARTLLFRRSPVRFALLNSVVVLVAGIGVALASGVFAFPHVRAPSMALTMSSAVGSLPGWYKFNLLSPLDPEGWSYILPSLPGWLAGEIEGFSYLGAGWLLLLSLAAVAAIRRPSVIALSRQHYPLAIVLLCLLIFAASPLVSIGPKMFAVPWPSALIALGSIFRSTGRFAWPVFYTGIIFVLWILRRTLPGPTVTLLMCVGVLLQVGDTSAGWKGFSATVSSEGAQWPSPMKSPFWRAAAQKYHSIRLASPMNRSPVFRDVSYFALRNGLGVDAVYLGRVNAEGMAALSAAAARSKATGVFGDDAIWILDPATYQILRRRPPHDGDFVGEVDGYLVLAPRYYLKPVSAR